MQKFSWFRRSFTGKERDPAKTHSAGLRQGNKTMHSPCAVMSGILFPADYMQGQLVGFTYTKQSHSNSSVGRKSVSCLVRKPSHSSVPSASKLMLQPPCYLPSKIRMLRVIRFHPSHRLFSRLRNHALYSQPNYSSWWQLDSSWWLGNVWCLFRAI